MSDGAADCRRTILSSLEPRDVLDVGCGSGSFTRTLAEMLGRVRSIVGIDPDKDSIDEARRYTDDRAIRYRMVSGAAMPFHDGRFDLVSISNALHHLDDPRKVLAEMRRVAAPEANLVVQELVCDGLSPAETNGRGVHHFKAWIDRLHGRTHRPTYSRGDVRWLVRDAEAVIEAECEVADGAPEGPDSERVADALGFLAEYLEFARDRAGYDELEHEVRRLSSSLLLYGIATPPRLLIRARFARSLDPGAGRTSTR